MRATGIGIALLAFCGAIGTWALAPNAVQAQGGVETELANLPDADPGQCFAKVLIPAEYKEVSEKVTLRDASHKIEIVPAKYEWVEEKVLVGDASSKLVEVPAEYETARKEVEVSPARKVWMLGRGRGAKPAGNAVLAAATALGLPETSQPGQCFAEFREKPQYTKKEEKVLKREASSKIEIVPAKYAWAQEKVLVRAETAKLVTVPAVYETVTEKVLIAPATKQWKKGRGPIERVDHATGDIMCMVEVPAKFKTVKKRVLKTPATTNRVKIPAKYDTVRVRKLVEAPAEKRVEIPAKYTTVIKTVLDRPERVLWRSTTDVAGIGSATGRQLCLVEVPAKSKLVTQRLVKVKATTRKVEIPAKYKTVRVRKVVSPAQERKIEIPAKVDTLVRREKISSEKLAWRPVLCETNAKPGLVTQIQQALADKGYDPGAIDGVIGSATLSAVDEFQRNQNMERGGVTVATLKALGVVYKP